MDMLLGTLLGFLVLEAVMRVEHEYSSMILAPEISIIFHKIVITLHLPPSHKPSSDTLRPL